jgi:hypothetical protein
LESTTLTVLPEIERLLDFDAEPKTEVRLGGRTYFIGQQRRALMERILALVYPAGAEDEAMVTRATVGEIAQKGIERWAEHTEAFAYMLGVDPDEGGLGDTLAHLEKHLSWPAARRIFEAWYRQNDVLDFLQRDGNALIPAAELEQWNQTDPETKAKILEAAKKRLGEAEPSPTSSPETPTSP